jgi:ribonuclease E
MPEPGAPGFDSPPSLALEEEFTASEADYSAASPPDTASHEETRAEPAQGAAEPEVDAEARTSGATRPEPAVDSSAPAETEAAPEVAPASAEPPRPRRSGWWQRARATVIGK